MGTQNSSNVELRKKISFIQRTLLEWYENSGRRNLPWRREDVSPFHKLIAEVLLQKTRAENIIEIYEKIVEKYPGPTELAQEAVSKLEELLRPLGLYRVRAKNLVELAKVFSNKAEIPCNRDELENMPGVGPYIANTFLVSVCNKRVPVVDTNIKRFINRVFSIDVKRDPRRDPRVWDFVEDILPETNYREFIWALLDFAALVCKSSKPKCSVCPLSSVCDYYRVKMSV
jgi:A/G-specific adenine glycosylase